MTSTSKQSIEIFLSYAPEDEELRNKLEKHLKSLEREGAIAAWHERKITPGTERDDEIEKHLNSAQIILLLISANFIASEQLWERDVRLAMQRHTDNKARVIPVLLRPCDWKGMPFGKLEALPKSQDDLAVTSWTNQDEAFQKIAEGIRKTVNEISGLQESKEKKSIHIPWRSIITIVFKSSLPITFIIVVLRFFGIFEASELWLFDQMMTLTPPEEQDERLLIIEVTKRDIEKLETQKGDRRGSLTDKTLLNILKKLLDNPQNQPKTIGIDIYRDYATNKTPELAEIIRKNSRIFAVCNVGRTRGQDGVKPPPELPLERLGFSDFIQDKEGIVRRQLLFMEGDDESPCKSFSKNELVKNSFSLQLVQHYLHDLNKPYQEPFKDPNQDLKIGDTVFNSLYGSYRSGYSMFTDLNGYQILLNYRISCSGEKLNICSPEQIAKKVTIEKVLNEDVLKNYDLKNRIVLIGVTDPSYEPFWTTPFSFPNYEPIPGVIIQAQMVSQILSTVLDKRPLLKVWSIWYEIVWIFAWSLIGGTLVQLYRFKKIFIISGGLAFIILPLSCLIMFISPTRTWIPFLPPALSFISTGGVVVFFTFKNQRSF